MISRRGIVIIVLIGLAVVASSARPWVSGAKLLEAKYSSRFDPYIDMGGRVSASAPFEEAFSAAGIKRVAIQAPIGNITVIKTGGNSIAVEGERIAYGDTIAEAEAKLPLVSIETQTRDDVLEIVGLVDRSATSGLSGMINMVIQVPAGVDVESTLSMGKIDLDGIEGAIRAEVDMGGVNAHSTRGDLDVKVAAGAINVSDAVVARKLNLVTSMGPIDFAGVLGENNHIESSAGPIMIRIPRSTCVRVDADASAGQIESSFPIMGLSSENLKSSAMGILGEGTPTGELRVRTSGGEIHISEL
jgi:hypothetical protein